MTAAPLKNLPLFVIENEAHRDVLLKVAEPVSFPLSSEDRTFIDTLKYMVSTALDKCVGLAAPQVGVSKKIIVFQILEGTLLFRRDVEFLTPLTTFINPSYVPHEEEGKSLDWEPCYSIQTRMGKVWRYKTITYKAQTEEGKLTEGIAHGFLARLLQHEIDHLNGQLALDLFDPNSPHGLTEEMRPIRLKEVEDLAAAPKKNLPTKFL